MNTYPFNGLPPLLPPPYIPAPPLPVAAPIQPHPQDQAPTYPLLPPPYLPAPPLPAPIQPHPQDQALTYPLLPPPYLPAPPLLAPTPIPIHPHPQDQPLTYPLPPTEPRARPNHRPIIPRPVTPFPPPTAPPPNPAPTQSHPLPLPPRRIPIPIQPSHQPPPYPQAGGPLFHVHILPVSALLRGDILDEPPTHPWSLSHRITYHEPELTTTVVTDGDRVSDTVVTYRVAGVTGYVSDPADMAFLGLNYGGGYGHSWVGDGSGIWRLSWTEHWPADLLVRVWREGSEWREWRVAVDVARARASSSVVSLSSSSSSPHSDEASSEEDGGHRVVPPPPPPPLLPLDEAGAGGNMGLGWPAQHLVGPETVSGSPWHGEYQRQVQRRQEWLAEVRALVRPEFRVENGFGVGSDGVLVPWREDWGEEGGN